MIHKTSDILDQTIDGAITVKKLWKTYISCV